MRGTDAEGRRCAATSVDGVSLSVLKTALRNDVGLLAEEYDPRARRQVGNFPQAFSHLALIMTALSLQDVGPAQQRGQRKEARLVNPA